MKFSKAELEGLWLIELEPREDERGYLARTYCEEEFLRHRLNTSWPQCNETLTKKRGALRGLHFQEAPSGEIKLVRCTSGKVWDCAVDVRPDSPTFGKWEAVVLSPDNHLASYIPAGFAHGFQCLTDNCGLSYMMSECYVPELARGVRWDDPALAIPWPLEPTLISEKDRVLPLLSEIRVLQNLRVAFFAGGRPSK